MSNVKVIFESFLKETGRLELEKLGDTPREDITQNHTNAVKTGMQVQQKSNNLIIALAIVFLCIIFFIGIFFIFYYRDNFKTIAIIFSGTLLSLLGVISRLRRLWIEKSLIDISLNIIDDLSPQEAAKFIESIYWGVMTGKKDTREK